MEISLSVIFLLFKTSIYKLLGGKINTNQSTIIPREIAEVLKSELHVICNALRGKIGTIMVLARSDDEKSNVNCLVTWKARFDWMLKKKKKQTNKWTKKVKSKVITMVYRIEGKYR